MKKFLLSVLFLLSLKTCFSQLIPIDSLYLAQSPPTSSIPKRFFLPVSPQSFYGERIAISNDGKEIFYTVIRSYYPTAGDTIKYFKYSNNKWTGPFNLFNGYLAPALSLTGDTIYLMNNSIIAQTEYSVRYGESWSTPRRMLNNLNWAHYLQVTNSGNYYVSSIPNPTIGNTDWCRVFMTGTDTNAVSLGLPVCNAYPNYDFFVARDESFMILARDGLHISFRKNNGSWTNPKSLDSTINFGLSMWGPYVTSDNKYLFYTTGTNPNYSDTYIYWSRIDGKMDSLRQTNFVPYLKYKIPNQTDTVGHFYNYTFPDSTFIDDDGNNTLSYIASLGNGGALPSWLSFNPATRTFTGTPTQTGSITLMVVAKDTANTIAYCSFNLNVVNSVSIRRQGEKIINEYKLFQNYPNPFNPTTNIKFSVPKSDYLSLKIYNSLGKEVENVFSGYLNSGNYNVIFDAGNLSSGIYFYKLKSGDFMDIKRMVVIK